MMSRALFGLTLRMRVCVYDITINGVDDIYRVYMATRSRTAFAKGHFRSGTAAYGGDRYAWRPRTVRQARAIFLVARQVAAKIGGETTHPVTTYNEKQWRRRHWVGGGEGRGRPITIDAPLSSDRCGRGRLPPPPRPNIHTNKGV